MILYRPIRSTIDESMKEQKSFTTLEDLFNWVSLEHDKIFTRTDLIIEYRRLNHKNHWEEYEICTKRIGNTVYRIPQCVGYMTIK